MIEIHPFGIFVPANTKYLILGSFAGRQAVKGMPYSDETYDWFYGTKTNQFWPIMERVYGVTLKSKENKQELMTRLGIGIADIIYSCERKDGNNLDSNLINIVYALDAITQIFSSKRIKKVFFTSRFVERKFNKVFKNIIEENPSIELIMLPSPSRRYAKLTVQEKIFRFSEILPSL